MSGVPATWAQKAPALLHPPQRWCLALLGCPRYTGEVTMQSLPSPSPWLFSGTKHPAVKAPRVPLCMAICYITRGEGGPGAFRDFRVRCWAVTGVGSDGGRTRETRNISWYSALCAIKSQQPILVKPNRAFWKSMP